MKLSDAQSKYKNKWLLFKVTKQDDHGQAVEGEVLEIADNRTQIYNKLSKTKKQSTHYTTVFTGKTPPMILGAKPPKKP